MLLKSINDFVCFGSYGFLIYVLEAMGSWKLSLFIITLYYYESGMDFVNGFNVCMLFVITLCYGFLIYVWLGMGS